MDLRSWLSEVAIRNGAAPNNTRHYHGFSGAIRKDFPSLPLSIATAHAVGSVLGGAFPVWDELRAAIRTILTEVTGQDAETTPEQRMTALWVAFYHRRVREVPHQRDHLLSLLRSADMPAFLEVDDGHTERMNDAFDEAFWQDRGGHPGYSAHRHPDMPNLRWIALAPGRRSARAPDVPPPPPKPRHLTGDTLAAARQRAGIPT